MSTQPTTQPPAKAPFELIQTSTSLDTLTTSNTSTIILLVHATNAFGSWGAGFALALHNLYPNSSAAYKALCDSQRPDPNTWPNRSLVGHCRVILPQAGDTNAIAIACLFTSYGYGSRDVHGGKNGGHARKDGKEAVMRNTEGALKELREWIEEAEERGGDRKKVVVYSPKFNSGNFGVDWEATAGMIEEEFAEWEGEWRLLMAK